MSGRHIAPDRRWGRFANCLIHRRSPECGAVQVVASGERALQVRQPDELQIGEQTAAAVLDGDVDPHRDHQSVVGPQLVPGVAVDTVSQELIMVAPEQRLLQPPPFGDGPVKNSRVDQVVDTEPGGQAPVERLSVDQVERPGSRARDQNVGAAGIAVDDREPV